MVDLPPNGSIVDSEITILMTDRTILRPLLPPGDRPSQGANPSPTGPITYHLRVISNQVKATSGDGIRAKSHRPRQGRNSNARREFRYPYGLDKAKISCLNN